MIDHHAQGDLRDSESTIDLSLELKRVPECRVQLDRARKFFERVEGPCADDIECQNMVWSLFQHCWHVNDWLKNNRRNDLFDDEQLILR